MSEYKIAIQIAGELQKSFGSALKGAQSGLNGLAKIGKVGAAAIGASTAALGTLAAAGIRAGVEYEQAFAGVRKTVDATEQQLASLNTGIRNMAKEMPTSAVEIAGVAEAAGQLGIQTDNILGFTKTMVMLGDSTNLSADEAATALARLANITGMPQDSFQKLGSTIVALGNNFATTESEITAMGLRIAGAGSQVGMTEAQIMSFSAALSSVGIEAEAGGSAFSTLLSNMQLAVETGSESLQQFANVAGMSASEFKQAFQTDAAGAMASFIKGLSESEAKGKSAIAVLDEMGITEIRMRDMLLRAAGASDTFTEALELGTAAWDENVALTNEANQRYQTMGSRLSMLKNKAYDLGITFYNSVNEPMGQVVDSAGEALDNLSAAFESGGLEGLVSQFGTEIANAAKGIASVSPEMVEAGASMIESFLTGIDENSEEIATGMADTATAVAAGMVKLAPDMITVGAQFIIEFARGISDNLPELRAAAEEAASELIDAAGDAIQSHMDFLQDDSVGAFEKIISLLPAALAGFLAFKKIAGVAKNVKSFVDSIKGAGKIGSSAKQVQNASSVMSAAAKNMLGAGVGFGAAAAGLWLLVDAAIRIGEAGPGAAVGMIAMAAGIVGMMAVASKVAPQLQTGTQGLLAFGGAVLMASAGMSLMAMAATQIAAAGPLAAVSLGIMTAGMIGMLAVAGALGPSLTAGAVGLLAFGAAIIMASAGCLIMVQAATQLAAAGAPAQIAMAALAAGVLVMGAAAGALAPLLLAGAGALAAFGAALAVVSAAAPLGSAALTVIAGALPQLATYGASGAVAILQLGSAMMIFAAGAAITGVGAAAAALGLGTLALAGAAAALAMKPLASASKTVASSVKTINNNAKEAGTGLKSMAKGAVSTAAKMAALSTGLKPAASALESFSGPATAAATAVTTLMTGMSGTATAVMMLQVGIMGVTNGLRMAVVSFQMFNVQAMSIRTGTTAAASAFTTLSAAVPPLASSLATLNPPMMTARVALMSFSASLAATRASMAGFAASVTSSAMAFTTITATVQTSMTAIQTTVTMTMTMVRTTVQTTGTQITSITTTTTTTSVTIVKTGMSQMVAAVVSGCSQAQAAARSGASGIQAAFASVNLYSSGVNMMSGLINGMNAMRGSVMATASSIASAAASSINSALKIHSPSDVTTDSGQYTGQGLIVGMRRMARPIRKAAQQSMAQPLMEGAGVQRIEAPDTVSRSSVIGETVQRFSGGSGNTGSGNRDAEGNSTFIFSPTYHFEGDAPSRKDLEDANRMSQAEFEKMMKEYLRNNKRVSFA